MFKNLYYQEKLYTICKKFMCSKNVHDIIVSVVTRPLYKLCKSTKVLEIDIHQLLSSRYSITEYKIILASLIILV